VAVPRTDGSLTKEAALQATRTRQDQAFWHIVKDLHWRLDDGSGGPPPPSEPEFDHGGGGGVWPKWATHVIAFLLGGLTWGSLLLAPPLLPVVALIGVVTFVGFAAKRRWR
jgi:hypothetical protein